LHCDKTAESFTVTVQHYEMLCRLCLVLRNLRYL